MEDKIIDFLDLALGHRSRHYPHKGQISYNCPNCDNGRNKGNLEVNYHKNLFSCWSCRDEIDGVKGNDIKWLIHRFGDKELFREYLRLNPPFDNTPTGYNKPLKRIKLPKGTYTFSGENKSIRGYSTALEYLKNIRKLPNTFIEKYNLMFCNEGKFKGRIIIPSYNHLGELDYYLGRDYTLKSGIKYLNHENNKQQIIFNGGLINWDASVFLVEGVFDHFWVWNSIPVLGKSLSKLLTSKLQKNLKGNLYILYDKDATKAANNIKKQINYGNLRNRVFIITIEDFEDVAKTAEMRGQMYLYKKIKGNMGQVGRTQFKVLD